MGRLIETVIENISPALLGGLAGVLGGIAAALWKTTSAAFVEAVKLQHAKELEKERARFASLLAERTAAHGVQLEKERAELASLLAEKKAEHAATLERLKALLSQEAEEWQAKRRQEVETMFEEERRLVQLALEATKASLQRESNVAQARYEARLATMLKAFRELAVGLEDVENDDSKRLISNFATSNAYRLPRSVARRCSDLSDALQRERTPENREKVMLLIMQIEDAMRESAWGQDEHGFAVPLQHNAENDDEVFGVTVRDTD